VTANFTIGIDTGGTFTDSYVADSEGRHWTVKVPTTPHDLTVCFADAISQSASAVDLPRDEFLRRTSVIRFSSTIATNTALTLSGPKLGLIVTSGSEQNLYGAADGGNVLRFIPPGMVSGVEEEVTIEGDVRREPDAEQINRVVRDLLERGARILVVSLRNGAANPANELAVMRTINDSHPRHYLGAVPTLLSTHVSAVADDEGRTAAAVVNAYMHKKLATSLYKAEDDLRADGFRHPLLVVTADGTVTRVAKTRALSTYQSGPAAGVHASRLLCGKYDLMAALTADVGGTSTDLSLIIDGEPIQTRRLDVGGLDVAQSSVDLLSLALGGGSIASVADGSVGVGPESAAAAPGPASFGLGGRDPTPTDAWLVLGYLDPAYYLGGRRRLLPELARAALDERVGGPLGVTTEEAALEVKEAAELTVAEGIREMLQRASTREALGDRSLRDLALIAYGGGGGILLPSVAQDLGIGKVYLSSLSPVFSAFGVSTFDVVHRYETRAALNGTHVPDVLAPLVDAARRDIRGEGFDLEAATLLVEATDDEGNTLFRDEPLSKAEGRIEKLDLTPGSSIVLSLSASCEVPKPELPGLDEGDRDAERAVVGDREVVFRDGLRSVPVYSRENLRIGSELSGPCLIESSGSTYLVPDRAKCSIDRFGTAVIELNEEAR
jgi:N-methylhydantoinase A/acetophenone carboxylase